MAEQFDADKAGQDFDKDLAAFSEWMESTPNAKYHYTLADTVGASMLDEFRKLVLELVADGMNPVEAGKHSMSATMSFVFQMGYDFAKQSEHTLKPCHCERQMADIVWEKNKESDKPDESASRVPGMYL